MKAVLSNYRQAPRKVRLVADAISGKGVVVAEQTLSFMNRRAAFPIKKLLESAVRNAEVNDGISKDRLFVKSITVNKGMTLKRSMPRARGSAFPIHKHMSHVVLLLAQTADKKLGTKETKKAAVVAEKKEVKKTTKKVTKATTK